MGDRPITRNLIRAGWRLWGGSARAHGAEGWPHLRLTPDAIFWRGKEVAARGGVAEVSAALTDEAVILGSGPSLRGQSVERVPVDAAVVLNGSLTLVPRLGGAAVVAVIDERFVWRHGAMIDAHWPQEAVAILSVASLRALLSRNRRWADGRRIVIADGLLKPYGKPRRGADHPDVAPLIRQGPGGAAVSLNPDVGVMPAGTVALTALQMVLATRVRRIGLAGIDLSEAPRFYEGDAVARSGMDKAEGRALPMLALAARIAAERGVRLESYSPVLSQKLDVLPFVDRLG